MEDLILPAIILGAVQGLTEFFPVSSTAHLIVLPRLLGWNNPLLNSLSFEVALHAGTLAALLIAFRSEWVRIAPGLLKPRSKPGKFAWGLVLATIPAVIAGALLEKPAEGALRITLFVAFFLGIGAILLWWADARRQGRARAEKTGPGTAVLIGCAQAFAILPGLSRSGMTITAGLALGLSRREAARYSFLLSTPLIAAAVTWKLRHLHSLGTGEWMPMLAGTLSASLTGILAIRWLLKLAESMGYRPFAAYRLLLAASIVIWAVFRGIP